MVGLVTIVYASLMVRPFEVCPLKRMAGLIWNIVFGRMIGRSVLDDAGFLGICEVGLVADVGLGGRSVLVGNGPSVAWGLSSVDLGVWCLGTL